MVGSSNDTGLEIVSTPDSGMVLTGWTSSDDIDVSFNNGPGADVWLVKVDVLGNIQWETSLGGLATDKGYATLPTSDGGYIMAGSTTSSDGDIGNFYGFEDIWIVKITSTGLIEWEKNYGGTDDDECRCSIVESNGGFTVVGATRSNDIDVSMNHGENDIWVFHIDQMGNLLWETTLGGSESESEPRLIGTSDGGYLVVSSTYSNDGDVVGYHSGEDMWAVKLDSIGNIEWQNTLGGSDREEGWSVAELSTGYAVLGYTESNDGDISVNLGYDDLWLVRLDENGTMLWEQVYGGSSPDEGNDMLVANDGGLVIAGTTRSNDGDVTGHQSSDDFWIMKLYADDVGIGSVQPFRLQVSPNPNNAVFETSIGQTCKIIRGLHS